MFYWDGKMVFLFFIGRRVYDGHTHMHTQNPIQFPVNDKLIKKKEEEMHTHTYCNRYIVYIHIYIPGMWYMPGKKINRFSPTAYGLLGVVSLMIKTKQNLVNILYYICVQRKSFFFLRLT